MTGVAAGSTEGRGPAVRRTTALLYAVFLLSGAAGLIYESIWTRYLGLFVGHSAYAQVIVLVIFLGGMSLGAYLIGRWTLRIERPLFWYAIVEMATGIVGLVFHLLFVGVVGVAIPFTLFGYGEQRISSVLAGIWNATTPLIALPVAALVFRTERWTLRRVVGVLVGFLSTHQADPPRPAMANLQIFSKRMVVLPEYRSQGIGYRLVLHRARGRDGHRLSSNDERDRNRKAPHLDWSSPWSSRAPMPWSAGGHRASGRAASSSAPAASRCCSSTRR